MGATGGGVWKTTDAGTRWTNVSDEEFEQFLGIPSYLMPAFKEVHGDLFSPDYYQAIQRRLLAEEVIDIASVAQRDGER